MRALVTGSAVRLGRAIALALQEAGFEVVLHHNRSAPDLPGMKVQADLSTAEGCEELARRAGPVDVLVNSAALWEQAPLEAVDAAAFDRILALNLRAPLLLTRAALPGLRASALPGGGLVVNIADVAAQRAWPGFSAYIASKAGLLGLTRALAVELAPQVRVNSVSPGTVLPPEGYDVPPGSIPAGRPGTPEDVARLVVFLALQAPYVTGQDWAVDGGRAALLPGGP